MSETEPHNETPDRLAEIKAWFGYMVPSDEGFDDIEWLVAEVERMSDEKALLRELYEWALHACHQGSGAEYGTPEWHSYITVWQEAEELFPRVEAALGIPVKPNDESRYKERNG